jgi:hypothetical protein
MSLRTGRPTSNLWLKVIAGIVAFPLVLGIMFFVLCSMLSPLIFFMFFLFFTLWGSRIFAIWFFGGVILWCGIAHYAVFQMEKEKHRRPNEVVRPLYGIGWFFSLAGVVLFLIFWKSGWSLVSAMLCEIGASVCWHFVERSKKKQDARMQLLTILHQHTQAKLQHVEHLDEYPELS